MASSNNAQKKSAGQLAAAAGNSKELITVQPRLEEYSDVSFILHSRPKHPVREDLIRMLNRVFRGAATIIADDFTSTYYDYLTTAQYIRSSLNDLAISPSNPGSHNVKEALLPLKEALKQCRTEIAIVINGDGAHPPERAVSMISELRDGGEFVISSSFDSAHGGKHSERNCSSIELFLARLYLRRRGYNISDPFSGYYAIRKSVIPALLGNIREARLKKGGSLSYELLRGLNHDIDFVQMHHASYFSPGFVSQRHG